MQNLEYIKQAKEGKIVIELPEGFEGKHFRVSVKAIDIADENKENWHLLPPKEKLEILQRFKGTAKYPDVEINKYDVYDQ